MTKAKVSRWISIFLTFLLLTILSACDGSGGAGVDDGNGDVLPPGNEAPPSDTETSLSVDVVGEAVPGQQIRLVASADDDAAMNAQWEQTGGPTVALEAADASSVQFRVPPVSRDTAFSFRVTVTDRDGRTYRRRMHVKVGALTWKDLEVVEIELTDNYVVFRANKDNSLRIDLYRADLDGTNIVRLNGPLAPGANVSAFSISPDGGYVAYLADEDTAGVQALFIVNAYGGNADRVSGDLVAGGNVTQDFLWAPDSSRVAYRADQNTDEQFELFAGFVDGSTAVRLSGDMTANGDVSEANFFWSDDSRRIAYRANQFNDSTLELFVSNRNGGGNVRVSRTPVVDGGVLGNFAWMPGGRQLAYVADQQSVDVFELFVVNDDGSGNTRVSGPLVTDGSVLDFAWSPDGDYIAYRAEQLADGVVELYSVLPDGTDNTLVSALQPNGDVDAYAWARDGSAIAYLADQELDDVVELFAAGPDGAANRKLSGPLTMGGNVSEFAWAPDGSYLAYRADQENNDLFELFASSPDGATNVKVSGPQVMGGNVQQGWRWSGDSNWIVYRADQRTDQVLELFSSTPDGASNFLVSGSLVTGGNVEALEGPAFEIAPDSTRIVYSADQSEDDKYELYVTSPDSGIAIASISGALTSGGDVREFALASRPGEQTGPKNIAVVSDNAYAPYHTDVVAKLTATGLFESVDLIIRVGGAPTLAQLMNYRAVIVQIGCSLQDPAGFGNLLADYIDAGGGVVTGSWSLNDASSTCLISGRFLSQGYNALVPGRGINRPQLTMAATNHPIVNGLTFDGGANSYRLASNNVTMGSTVVAHWSNMQPLVVTKVISGVRRVDLNVYLASSTVLGGGWNAMTDGDLLLANSLLWVMGEL